MIKQTLDCRLTGVELRGCRQTNSGADVSLKLYMHPLSSYCHKALIALYENSIPFAAKLLDNATVYSEFKKMWPIGRFPLLRDDSRDTTVPESSIIIEYLALHYPGSVKLLP